MLQEIQYVTIKIVLRSKTQDATLRTSMRK